MLEKFKTRDNFWNIMFWLGISLSLTIAEFLDSTLLVFVSLTIVPYILAKLNKVTFTKDNVFVSIEGETLKARYPLSLHLILTINVIINLILIANFGGSLSFSNMVPIFLLIPTLYFIYLNCPISILFNPNAWCKEVIGFDPTKSPPYNANINPATSINEVNLHQQMYDPRYLWHPLNIFNSRNRKK